MSETVKKSRISTQMTESYMETTTITSTSEEVKTNGTTEKSLKKKKSKKSRSHEKENISVDKPNTECYYNVNVKNLCRSFGDLSKLDSDGYNNNSGGDARSKSSFSKFDALQKKNVLHVRSSDSSKAQEKFNGNQIDNTNCKACGKIVFQMEQMKAEKAIWHKNCFRCTECNKQLTVDTYQSNEGVLYCKPHFKALFAPKVVEEDAPPKPRKHEMIIRENQPVELPPDVVRASDKPDLGLEELHSLNVKERFQVFEHHEEESNQIDRSSSAVNVKRSASILSKLAKFQAKGMDVGVSDDTLNGIPIEESSSEEEEEEEIEGEDADLIRAKRVQKEKPFHFTGMSDVKNKWEHGEQNGKNERREERKQELQSIRSRIFMGKQGKMKEAYQQAVMESESGAKLRKSEEVIEAADTRSIKEKFEKGEIQSEERKLSTDPEELEVFQSGITKKSRSIFLELDANAAKAPQLSPVSPGKEQVRKGREQFLSRQASENVVKSTETVEDVTVQTADIQQRFNFFETYKEPEKQRKQFRITPPREGQVKADSPERDVYHDPEVVRSEESVDDSIVAKQNQTAKKMLNKFRQMEEDLSKDQVPLGPKPLKRFTPPPEPVRSESESEEADVTDSGEEEECDEEQDEVDKSRNIIDEDLLEAQKAARAKQLRAKFEKWEANEIKREQNMSAVNLAEEFGEEQSQIESTRALRARFESMKQTQETKAPRTKVNRFV